MFRRLAVCLLFATGAFSSTIKSISPTVGPIAGGTLVTIKGTGFSNSCIICSPPFAVPRVLFGLTPSTEVHFIDSTTLEAVTPVGFPSTLPVIVEQLDGTGATKLDNAFTFQGDPNSVFEPILFPLFMQATQGAFGSRFQTIARLSVKAFDGTVIPLYGIDGQGPAIDPSRPPYLPFLVDIAENQPPLLSKTPGRVLWAPKGSAMLVAGSIRVTDLTKQASSFGVEVPVARAADFVDGARLVFMGVPADSRFRCTLRLYSLLRGNVRAIIRVNNRDYEVFLHRVDDQDLFEPAYQEFTTFPSLGELPLGQTTFRVVVDPGLAPGGVPIPGSGIWGMLSVTNNETEQITIITPN